jgi:hypothetical protein
MRDFNYVLSLARGFARPVARIGQTPKIREPGVERHAPGPGPSPRSRPRARSVR